MNVVCRSFPPFPLPLLISPLLSSISLLFLIIIAAIYNLLNLISVPYMYMCLELTTHYWRLILEENRFYLPQLLIACSSLHRGEGLLNFLYWCWHIDWCGLFMSCEGMLLSVCECNTPVTSIRHYFTEDILFWPLHPPVPSFTVVPGPCM